MAILYSILFYLKEHSTSNIERCRTGSSGYTLIRLMGRYKVSDEADKKLRNFQTMEIVNRRNGLKWFTMIYRTLLRRSE